ncbi:cysteine-tryptophan domain-containing zinc finger protein 7 [Lolium perenne]|uniref:cysteine-tryptophan domain-containing zinc finger protein 7 n=1 Tax=Lolium perenne TaxID=4522 RepID=UPI0021F5F2BA|nr:cysteine-tryptophan domain-containing zinc finger protein 7-like [Lolium perenne]
MLSVRRRQEDAGGALRGGMDEDGELEEGEAYGDDTAFVDPDVALSYIDEKLQDVLGHFQKDFEGGVSAENLGSKFGGYGSFLPTYQRSPLLPQTRTPPKAANLGSRSPYHQSIEAVPQNPTSVAVPSVSQNSGSALPFSGDSVKKERCESATAKRSTGNHDPSYGSSKSSDQNRFKVRIKVGSDNVLARNNAAIYSGLGLDISSPSSVEDSPDGYRGLSPEFDNVQLESPRTILQIMTCFSVPGGFLLSPLKGSILQLTKKVVPSSKTRETSVDIENAQEASEGHVVKKMKPDGKKKKPIEVKRSSNINDPTAVMKKEIDIETLVGQKIVSEALNIPILSSSRGMETKGESHFEEETAGKYLEGNKDARLKEGAINSNIKTIKTETVKVETTKCSESGGLGSSEMEFSAAKRELKPMTEKTATLEEMNTTNDTDLLLDRKHERRIKPESKSNGAGVSFEDNTVIDERTPAVCRSMEKVPSKETLLYDASSKNNTKSEAKRIHREQKKNAATSSDFLDVDNGARSSAAVKERKHDSQSKSSHSGKKPKPKSHRDVKDSLPDGSYGCKEQVILENGGGLGELQPKEKSWSKRDIDMPGASKREISSGAKHDRHTASEEQKMHVPPASVSTANAAPAPQVPHLIDEHWVQCDICQKWRLLPYETDMSTLPKEWKCSMQLWLPGMNRCDVGEDETTNALNALYVLPAPANGIPPVGHSHVASSGLTTAFNVNGHAEQSRKRKSAPGDRISVIDGGHSTQASAYPVSSQHAPTRIKSSADSNQYHTERNSVSKSVDPFTEKKKSKSKSRGSHSDGGDLMERPKKHSKGKSKREIDHCEYKASKKIKKEDRHRSSRDRNAKCDLASGDIPDEAKALLLKATILNNLGEKGDVSSLKQQSAPRYDRLDKSKRDKDDDVVLSEDRNKETFHTSDAQRSDFSTKKRIVKEWEESQHNSTAHVSNGTTVNHSSVAKETYKDQNLKETKPKLKKSEELYSTTDFRSVKGQILSCNEGHVNNELVEDSTDFAGKRGLNLVGPASGDMAHIQTAAVTSSSSKASDSQKKKHNSHVAKISPIESVSSSPVRNSNIDKPPHNRILEKDGPMNTNSSTMPSSVKHLNSEAGIVDNVRQAKKSKDSLLASEPVLHSSLQGSSDKDDDLVQLTRGHAPERLSLRKGLDDDTHHASGRKDSTVNGSSASRGYNHLHSGDKNSSRTDGSVVQPRAAVLDAKGDTVANAHTKIAASMQDRNGSTHCPPDGNFQPQLSSGKDKLYPKSNKQDTEKPKAQMVPSPLKETHSTPVKSNASKLTPQSRRCSDENGGQHGVSKQGTSNPADTSSPAMKDGNSTAAYALKEARDLKHKANRLKKEGKDLESTRLYFEAALKFLHVASLLEPPSIDGGKQGDAAQSMFSDTAKLCNFVAHEYERCKKMAAAALAYKCVEVAYLKAAYYKYPIASKDRQVLQAVVQTTPGESPSSSASDIDNLNNNGLSKKAPSNKDANSPQVAGNHLLLAVRNQPHLTRLLAYTNDVNCAFEATRKSQTAIASAAGNHEKGVDGVSSVRTVLDFNFRSVNDLLRLVRLSMESISC